MRTAPNRAGYSLIEVVVAASITAMLTLALFAVWDVGWGSWKMAEACASANDEVRKAMDRMIDDASGAGVLTLTGVPADGAWRTSFSFRKVDGIVDGEVVWSPDTISYSLGGPASTHLVRTEGADRRVVATGVRTFRVRRTEADPAVMEFSVEVESTVEHTTREDAQLALKIKLRN